MTKKPNDWMPLDVRKYLGDTMHLGRDQHGAYLLLIMAYWMRGAPLADSDQELAAIVRASQPDWRRLRHVMEPFFEVSGGFWVHHKIEKELARAREIIETKTKSGKAGAEKRWRTKSEPDGKPIADAMADAMANASQTDAPLPLPKPVSKKVSILPTCVGFDEFWNFYPRKVGKAAARKVFSKIVREGIDPAIIGAGSSRYAASVAGKDQTYIAHPKTWLNDGRWADEYEGSDAPKLRLVSSETEEQERENLRQMGVI